MDTRRIDGQLFLSSEPVSHMAGTMIVVPSSKVMAQLKSPLSLCTTEEPAPPLHLSPAAVLGKRGLFFLVHKCTIVRSVEVCITGVLLCVLFAWLISQQPTVLFSQKKPAISNQPAVLFSQNKSAPANNNQPNEQADA
jgi:hypothetical protein